MRPAHQSIYSSLLSNFLIGKDVMTVKTVRIAHKFEVQGSVASSRHQRDTKTMGRCIAPCYRDRSCKEQIEAQSTLIQAFVMLRRKKAADNLKVRMPTLSNLSSPLPSNSAGGDSCACGYRAGCNFHIQRRELYSRPP